jgi:hypothetical protein
LPVGPKKKPMPAEFFHQIWPSCPTRAPELPIPTHPRATPRHNSQFVPNPLVTSPKFLNQRKFSLTLAARARAQHRRHPSLLITHSAGAAPACFSRTMPESPQPACSPILLLFNFLVDLQALYQPRCAPANFLSSQQWMMRASAGPRGRRMSLLMVSADSVVVMGQPMLPEQWLAQRRH